MSDFVAHLTRQAAFSRATWGPGQKTEGVLDHIQKEIEEVRKSNEAPEEWVDLVILSLDGLLRSLMFTYDGSPSLPTDIAAERAVKLIAYKQSMNESRVWPDWRTADPNKAIEHVRE